MDASPRHLTNPAKRLHQILAGAGNQPHAHQPFRHYLAALLGGTPSNDLEMFRKLLGLYDLVALTDHRLSNMKHLKRATFAGCIKPIITTLQGMQLDVQAQNITNQLGGGPLLILDLASDALDQEQPEFELRKADLDNLYADAERFEGRIRDADLAPELQTLLLDCLVRIKAALKNYMLAGLEGIDRAVKEAYGTGLVERATVLAEKDNPIVRDFWDWLGGLNETVSGCKSAYTGGLIGGATVIQLLENIDPRP